MADDFDPYYTWLGIPPKDQPPTHYRLLGVELFEGNLDVVENAADRQMAHVRLFQNGPQGERSQKLLNEITSAKLCLLSPARGPSTTTNSAAAQQAAEEAARPQSRRQVRGSPKDQPLASGRSGDAFDETLDVVSLGADRSSRRDSPRQTSPSPPAKPHSTDAARRPKKAALADGRRRSSGSECGLPGDHHHRSEERGRHGRGKRHGVRGSAPGELGKKSSIDDPGVSPLGKTPPIEVKSKPPVDSKTPMTKPGPSKVVSPPAVGFESNRVLRFLERDYAGIADTVQNAGPADSPLAAEMWVRLNPTRQRNFLLGNLAVAGAS